MLTDGHFRLHRATFSHPIVGIARPRRFALWQWMVGAAYFRDADELARGQFEATMRQLANVVGMPLATLHAFKAELLAAGMVEFTAGKTNRDPALWKVVNYTRFQPDPSERKTERKSERKSERKPNGPLPATDGVCDGVPNANRTDNRTQNRTQNRTLKKENLQKENLRTKTSEVGAGEREDQSPPLPFAPLFYDPDFEIRRLLIARYTDRRGHGPRSMNWREFIANRRAVLIAVDTTDADIYRGFELWIAAEMKRSDAASRGLPLRWFARDLVQWTDAALAERAAAEKRARVLDGINVPTMLPEGFNEW